MRSKAFARDIPDPAAPSARIALSCGGTGGHVLPGLATARELHAAGSEVLLLLSGRPAEQSSLAEWSGKLAFIPCRPPRWRSLPGMARSLASLAGSAMRSFRVLRRYRPGALLAMGSYTSFGPVLAARLLRIPVVLHEANAIPGVAIARLAPLASGVALSFEEASAFLPSSVRTFRTGLPVRLELARRPPLPGFESRTGFTVLVMGGSQGAHAVNESVLAAFRFLQKRGVAPVRILHLAGCQDAPALRSAYTEIGLDATVLEFLDDMGGAYACADLCISRSGAASCFELCLCGVPAILIPLPSAVRDHQTANARVLERTGGAELLPQSGATPERLAERIDALRRDPDRRVSMRSALKTLACPDAARRLAELVRTVADRDPGAGPAP